MPVRYTCRVSVFPTESGKFRLGYAPLDIRHAPPSEMPVRLLTINGPAMVPLPERELTAAELDRWEFDLCCGTGFSFSFGPMPASAALVEAHRTIEDLIPKGAVTWAFHAVQNERGDRTFAVELKNTWGQQIPKIGLATCWEHETPQKHPAAPAKMNLREHGGSESVFHRLTPVGGDALPPHYPVPFAYAPDFLPALRSRVAALSPERYWVALTTEGHEFDRIPGPAVAAFLDTLSA